MKYLKNFESINESDELYTVDNNFEHNGTTSNSEFLKYMGTSFDDILKFINKLNIINSHDTVEAYDWSTDIENKTIQIYGNPFGISEDEAGGIGVNREMLYGIKMINSEEYNIFSRKNNTTTNNIEDAFDFILNKEGTVPSQWVKKLINYKNKIF